MKPDDKLMFESYTKAIRCVVVHMMQKGIQIKGIIGFTECSAPIV